MLTTGTLAQDDAVPTAPSFMGPRRTGGRAGQMRPRMQTLSDMDLEAFVDGELPLRQIRSVEQAIETDSVLQARYQALLNQKRLLQMWWRQFS